MGNLVSPLITGSLAASAHNPVSALWSANQDLLDELAQIRVNQWRDSTYEINSYTANSTFYSQASDAPILGSDGRIYFASSNASGFVILNPMANQDSTLTDANFGYVRTSRTSECVLTPNGKLFCLDVGTWGTAETLFYVVDIATQTATDNNFGLTPTNGQLSKMVQTLTGKIFIVPKGSGVTSVIYVDSVAATASRETLGLTFPATSSWTAGVLGKDGKIYYAPNGNSTTNKILIIDPATMTATISDMGVTFGTYADAWLSGRMGPDGKIYFCPNSGTRNILIIDVDTQTASLSTMGSTLIAAGSSTFPNSVMMPDGKLYFKSTYTAGGGGNFLCIDTLTNTAYGVSQPAFTAFLCGTVAPDGRMFSFYPTTGVFKAIFPSISSTDGSKPTVNVNPMSLSLCRSPYVNHL